MADSLTSGGALESGPSIPAIPAPAANPSSTAQTATLRKTEFFWQHTGASWHLLLYLLLAIGLAWLALRRYGPAPAGAAGRVARACRVAAVLVLVAMIAGPAWRTTETTVVPGRALVAIDRSASMQRSDAPGDRPRIAVASDLRDVLAPLAASRDLVLDWQSIGGVAGPLLDDDFADGPPTAHGAASPLSEELVRLLDASPYDLLVLLSDGRVTAGPGLEALATQLRASGTDLAILPVGGDGIDARILIDQIVVNPAAALGEREPVTVRGSVRGLGDGPVTIRVWVDGAKTDEIQVDAPIGEPGALLALEQRLEATFAKEGAATVRVDVEQGALTDSREMTVQVSQRKLQVLILDHRPRYEIRYLREALKRDHTIELSAWLCDGKRWRAWTSGGPTDHLPLTAAELRDYDAIVIGDIAPDTLTNEQMRNIVEAVKRRGTGLLWLPGELGATAGFTKTELGQLIPTRLPDADRLAHGYLDNAAHRLRRTPAAEKNLLFESGAVPWDQLPPQLGAGDLGEPVPGAEVLMEDQDAKPMAVYKTYGVGGSGRGVILAVDDTWRWRRNVGDAYLQRFHGQLLRFVGRRSGARPWRIGVEPRRAIPGEVVKLSLTPLTAEAGEAAPDAATAILVGPGKREMLVHLLPDGGGFSARVPAPDAGQWRIGVADGPNPGDVEDGELDVFPPSSEVREPRADRPALEALARAAGGRLFPDAAALAAALPDVRKDRVEALPPRGLWDNAWAFAAIAVLLAIEWSLRRIYRLP